MIVPPSHAARLCITLVAAAGLAACSPGGDYPSLAPRAIERPADDDAAAAPLAAAALPADPALDREVAELAGPAESADAEFDRGAAAACAAVTRGAAAAEGSEPWIAAQQALSALEATRAPVLAAAAALDRLVIERGTSAGAAVDLSGLAAAQDRVSRLDAAEQARLAELAAGRCAR